MFRRFFDRNPLGTLGRGFGRGRQMGTRPGSGPGGTCVCPKCGYRQPHLVGQPCYDTSCPHCNISLVRE